MELNRGRIRDRGLDRYVSLVADALGLAATAYYTESQPPVHVYLALDARFPDFPDRDTALTWDERHGWAGAVESISGDDLVVVAYLGHDILPPPHLVARFARDLTAGRDPGQSTPPGFRTPDTDDDLPQRLAAYSPPPMSDQN
jgi:hypothetical protein